MIGRRLLASLPPALLALVAAGCGMPDKVTYHDPNPPSATTSGSAMRTPIEHYGADVGERGLTLVRMQARVVAARALATSGGTPTASLRELAASDWPTIEPILDHTDAATARRVRTSVIGLDGQRRVTAAQLDELADVLADAEAALVPRRARDDRAFRAALLHETLGAAAQAYEHALADGDAVASPTDYELAYGLLAVARSRTPQALGSSGASLVESRIARIALRATPSPEPPSHPADAATVTDTLATIQDRVDELANIDSTRPLPTAASVTALADAERVLRRAADAPQAKQRHAVDRAWTALQRAAPSIAAVDPAQLVALEQTLAVKLAAAIEDRTFDAQVDAAADAIGQVRDLLAAEIDLAAHER